MDIVLFSAPLSAELDLLLVEEHFSSTKIFQDVKIININNSWHLLVMIFQSEEEQTQISGQAWK